MFDDPDPIEEEMGVKVEQMSPDQLIAYLKRCVEVLHGVRMVVGSDNKERFVFQGLRNQYKLDAGRIVKWVVTTHQARDDGKIVGFFSFTKARKWWLDKMYSEMQQHVASERRKEERRRSAPKMSTFADFLQGSE